MSIPRDLKVKIPGYGSDKINAAYEIGGPRKTVATVKKPVPRRHRPGLPDQQRHQRQLRRLPAAVNYIGGVYVDVDRRYFNDNTTAGPAQGYATINIQPGYQKLKGQDALDYVRYRHGDNDFFRAARQQDFLRQIARPGQRAQAARLRQAQAARAGSSAATSRSTSRFLSAGEHHRRCCRWACSWSGARAGRAGPLPGRREPRPVGQHVPLLQEAGPEQTLDEFMTARRSTSRTRPRRRRNADKPSSPSSRHQPTKPSSIKRAGARRVDGREHGRAGRDAGHLGFPFYFPTLRTTGSSYAARRSRASTRSPTRRARPPGLPARALQRALYGEYYGVQGMSWRYPPILDGPDDAPAVGGRTAELLLRRQAAPAGRLATKQAVYWVTNTLTRRSPNSRLDGHRRSARGSSARANLSLPS